MENKIKKVKLDPLLIRDLWSGEDTIVLKTLKKLRSVGNIGYIPELLKLLNQANSEYIRTEIVQFIADVKKPAIIPFILSGLKDPELKEARGYIITACWQSGLDYSHDLPLFIRIFMEGDYATALEAFTVIEESAVNLSMDELAQIRILVLKDIEKVSEEKKPLALELVKLLQE
jgi:hypothetical protein